MTFQLPLQLLEGAWDVYDIAANRHTLNFTFAAGGGALEGSLLSVSAAAGASRQLRVEAAGLTGALLQRAAAGGATWSPVCQLNFIPTGPALLSAAPGCTFSLDRAGFTLALSATPAEAFLARHAAAPATPSLFASLGPAKYLIIAALVVFQGAVRWYMKRGRNARARAARRGAAGPPPAPSAPPPPAAGAPPVPTAPPPPADVTPPEEALSAAATPGSKKDN